MFFNILFLILLNYFCIFGVFIEKKIPETIIIKDPQFLAKAKRSEAGPFEEVMGFYEEQILNYIYKAKSGDKEEINKYNNLMSNAFEQGNKEEINKQLENLVITKDLKKLIADYASNFLINSVTNERFQVGQLKVKQIGLLRKSLYKKLSEKEKAVFNIISFDNTDITYGYLQTLKENNDAVFQIFTEANTLGYDPLHRQLEEGSKDLLSYFAMPALIYRKYFYFYNSTEPAYNWRQTRAKQINLLDNPHILKNFPNWKGFINPYEDLNKINDSSLQKFIKIGYLPNIQIVTDDKTGKYYDQTVNHIYAPFMFRFGDIIGHPILPQIIETLLNAGYDGASMTAIMMNKKRVFLDGLNHDIQQSVPWLWISNSILKNINLIKKSKLNITLCISELKSKENYKSFYDKGFYGKNIKKTFDSTTNDLEQFKENIMDLVQETNGKFLIYKSDGIYELTRTKEKKANNIDDFFSLFFSLSRLSSVH